MIMKLRIIPMIVLPIVGYVPQNTALFDDSIWNNITFLKINMIMKL